MRSPRSWSSFIPCERVAPRRDSRGATHQPIPVVSAPVLVLCRQDTELPEQIAAVPINPVVNTFAVLVLSHGAAPGDGCAVGRRNAHQRPAMSPLSSPAHDDKVAVGEDLVNREMEIRKGGDIDLHELAQTRRAPDRCWDGVATGHIFLIHELYDTLGIVGVPRVDDLSCQFYVVLFAHDAPRRCPVH